MRSPGAAFDLRAAMTQELKAALVELDAGEDWPNEAHRCRVRLKRARAIARVGRIAAPGLAEVFDDSARGVMRMLAQAHHLSALADTARMIAATARPKSAEALSRAADALEKTRDMLPGIDPDVVRAGLNDLIALAQVWPEPSARQIRVGAKRLAKRARRARRRGRAAKDAPRRHEWRKREKDRFYAADILGRTWPGRRGCKNGAALGHLLGLERDARFLLGRLALQPTLAGDASDTARARRAVRKHYARVRRRANRLGDRLLADDL